MLLGSVTLTQTEWAALAPAALHLDAEVLDLLAQGVAVEAEDFGGPHLVAARGREGQLDERPLDFFKHPIVEPGRRQAVGLVGEIAGELAFDELCERRG